MCRWIRKIKFRYMERKFRKLIPAFLTLLVFICCTYIISIQIKSYISKQTSFYSTIEENSFRELPMVTICPWPPFHPLLLKKQGWNVSGDMYDIQKQYHTLTSFDNETMAASLWGKAGWRIGDIISSVKSNLDVGQPLDVIKAKRWRRTFTYIGPCFTYFPPLNETRVVIKLQKMPTIRKCDTAISMVMDTPKRLCFNLKYNTDNVRGFTNFLSYGLYIIDSFFVFVHQTHQTEHFSISVPLQSIKSNVLQKFMDGNYLFHEIGSDGVISKIRKERHNYLMTLCSSDYSYSQSECYNNCLEKQSQNERVIKCKPFLYENFPFILSQTCSSLEAISEFVRIGPQKCRKQCPPTCKRYFYQEEIATPSPIQSFEMSLASFSVVTITETSVYPFSKLLSDIGGICSLFLGISIFLVLTEIWRRTISKLSSYKYLKWISFESFIVSSVGLFTIGGTIVNCSLTMYYYIFQPIVTSTFVSTKPTHSLNSSNISMLHLKAALARRVSSRILGCRSIETDFIDCICECITRALLLELPYVATAISIEDLEYCNNSWRYIPTRRALLPGGIIDSLFDNETTVGCNYICKEQSNNSKSLDVITKFIEVDTEYSPITLFNFISRLGGGIGLFLGMSLYDCIGLLNAIKKCNIVKRFMDRTIRIISLVITVLMCCWQFHIYFNLQQFEVRTKFQSIADADVPTTTFCVWPPFDLDQLTSLIGNDLLRDFTTKNVSEQEIVLATRLNELSGNWEESIDHIWSKSSWKLENILSVIVIKYGLDQRTAQIDCDRSRCGDFFIPITSFLNRCYTFNVTKFDFLTHGYFFLNSKHLDSVKSIQQTVFVAIHSINSPVTIDSMYPVPHKRISHLSVYTSIYKHYSLLQHTHMSYESCFSKCYAYLMTTKYRCRLPYMTWLKNHPICNQTQYSEFPLLMSNLPQYSTSGKIVMRIGRNMNENNEISTILMRCRHVCRNTRSVHHSVSFVTDDYYNRNSVIQVTMQPSLDTRSKSGQLLEEVDLYGLGHLISDSGSFLGLTIGTSILSLVHSTFPW